MKVWELKKLLEKLDDDAEVVILREGNGQHYMPDASIVKLSSCYFGGESPDSDNEDEECLRLSFG